MALLTAAQIKAILETAVYPEEVEINAALMQNEERRKYPSIDVQNVTGQEHIKDFPTTTTGQTFLVHLFYRYRSFGEQHEPDIKALEDVIFNSIDANANFSTDVKISVSQSWDRKSETFPVHRSHSILTVSADEITATQAGGLPGDEMSIEFPAPLGELKLISLTSDGRDLLKDLDRDDTGEETFTKIHLGGLLIVEVQLTFDEETQMEALFNAGKDFTVTLTKSGNDRVLLVNPISFVNSATRDQIQTTLISMDIKP
jgi:hypothetical protein